MFDIQENLKKLPDSPGVYMHKDALGQVIYVGKAISLRNRVRQYFQSSKNQSPKVRAMVSHITEFEYITCKTEKMCIRDRDEPAIEETALKMLTRDAEASMNPENLKRFLRKGWEMTR